VHILTLFQHYHTPDCPTAARPYALVKALAARHRVTLVASDAWKPRRLARRYPWTPPDVEARWVRAPYANAMEPGRRLASFATFAAKALAEALRAERPDVILGSSTPLTVPGLAALAARWHRVPWVFEVQDLWPAFPIQMGAVPTPVLRRALVAAEHALYRDAARVVAVSPDMARHVEAVAGAAPVTMNPYGADLAAHGRVTEADLEALRRRFGLPVARRVVAYVGSFGRANALPTMLEAARRLARRSDACVVFAGDGFHREAVAEAASQLPHVHHLPPLPMPEALALFRLADLSLVSFLDRPVLATNAPSKLYDSLAAGTPVVVTNPGWTRAFVAAHGCGWFVPPEDAAALAARVAALLDAPEMLAEAGRRGAAAARTHFDRRRHMAALVATIEAAARRRPQAPAKP
jgi:glycosyltransferase involved in cell wall biosynthesis